MTYIPKRMNILSLNAKVESTVGTDASPDPATDGVLLQLAGETPNFMPDSYEFEGDIGENSVGLQPQMQAPPSGRSGSAEIPMYYRGFGAAYSAGNVPPNGWHTLMKGCGYTAAVTTTSGSEKWTYTPHGDSTAPSTLTLHGWSRQVLGAANLVKTVITAGLGSLKVETQDAKPPLWTFSYKGIFPGDPEEASFTLPTLTTSVVIPNSSSLTFSIDGTSLKAYSFAFDQARDLSTHRTPLTSSGASLGFVAGGMRPVLRVTIEDELFATFKGYTKRASAATAAVILGLNQSAQYNRIKLNAAQAQIIGVTPAGRGKAGLVDLDLLLTPSTPTTNDGHVWTAD